MHNGKSNGHQIASFFDTLQLGKAAAPAIRLDGGLLHECWKVVSSDRSYVIKKLNPRIMQKKGIVEKYEESEKVAASFHQSGVPAVAAIYLYSRYVHHWGEDYFIVYPFVEGKTIPLDKISLNQAGIIGQIFSSIHLLRLNLPLIESSPHYDIFDDDHWIGLVKDYKNPRLLGLLPMLLDWNREYRMCIERLNRDVLISHRDLHYSNVLWEADAPHVIDWESAGYTNPLHEIIGYALEWSGIIDSHFYQDRFYVIMESYRHQTRNSNSSHQDAFFGWLGNSVMGWLEFNLRRSKDSRFTEQERGINIVEGTMIPCLNFLNLTMDQIGKSIEKAMIEG